MSKRKHQRRKEVLALREEGIVAFNAGRSRQSVPARYLRTMDRYQWEKGWDVAAALARDGAAALEELA